MLDLLRVTAAEESEADRCPSRNWGLLKPGWPLSLVIVELLLVKEGTSSTDILTSGPGSPKRRDWKAFSSVIDDGAVEMRWASYENGERGDGNDEGMDRGLVGV